MSVCTDTTCPYCGVGCGVKVVTSNCADSDSNSENRETGIPIHSVQGDPDHPANYGRLCSKGSALTQTLSGKTNDANRLRQPTIDGFSAEWSEAISKIAQTFTQTINKYGPDSVALYVSGQLLTEDYYVANKLMKGYVGSANIDTNSRLCMASSVAGHRRAFGADTVPGCYEDIEQADLVVLTGSNLAWCHPVLFQRLQAAREKNPHMQVVVIDPRRTVTADTASLHLPIASDTDVTLFNGLLNYLKSANVINHNWTSQHTEGMDSCLQSVESLDISNVAEKTGLHIEKINDFYQQFANTENVVTVYSQGINQSLSGTDKVNAIINCHLATGRIGKPGCGPFSVTGQPNAMGGREVGGLANMLACHMDLDNDVHSELVQRYWSSPVIATQQGLKAVDLFHAMDKGEIKAVWIMATNPADSVADADLVDRALQRCDFVVVSDVVSKTDTSKHANVLLPAAAWSEKDGTVTNTERCISRQRGFRNAPGEAKADWWAICQVAIKMGFVDAFDYKSPRDIFVEYAGLSGFENNGTRDFDISAMDGISEREYDSLKPFFWPCRPQESSKSTSPIRFFADGGFYHPGKRARFIVCSEPDDEGNLNCNSNNESSSALLMNTGRIRDQWHTMTRTGYCTTLSSHLAEPYVEIHPQDAVRLNIKAAHTVNLSTETANFLVTDTIPVLTLRALITDRVAKGTVFVPMHWTDQFASSARVDRLIPGLTDKVSGQPGFKHVEVNLAAAAPTTYGLLLLPTSALLENPYTPEHSKQLPEGKTDYRTLLSCFSYWALSFHENIACIEFTSHHQSFDQFDFDALLQQFGMPACSDHATIHDAKNGVTREIWTGTEQELLGICYTDQQPVLADRSWLIREANLSLTDVNVEEDKKRTPASITELLAGYPSSNEQTSGAMVCACNSVGRNSIVKCIKEGNTDIKTIGKLTKAGTTCGSCQPELLSLLRQQEKSIEKTTKDQSQSHNHPYAHPLRSTG